MKLLKFAVLTITVYYKLHRKLRKKKKTLPDSIQKIFENIFKKHSVASVKGIRLWNNPSQETKRPNMRKRGCNVRPPPPPPFWCISRMHSACLDSCGIADEQIDNTQHVYMGWSWDIVKIFFPALLYLGFWKLFNCFIWNVISELQTLPVQLSSPPQRQQCPQSGLFPLRWGRSGPAGSRTCRTAAMLCHLRRHKSIFLSVQKRACVITNS